MYSSIITFFSWAGLCGPQFNCKLWIPVIAACVIALLVVLAATLPSKRFCHHQNVAVLGPDDEEPLIGNGRDNDNQEYVSHENRLVGRIPHDDLEPPHISRSPSDEAGSLSNQSIDPLDESRSLPNQSENRPNESENPSNMSGNPPSESGNPPEGLGIPPNESGNPPNESEIPRNKSGNAVNEPGNPSTQAEYRNPLNQYENPLDESRNPPNESRNPPNESRNPPNEPRKSPNEPGNSPNESRNPSTGYRNPPNESGSPRNESQTQYESRNPPNADQPMDIAGKFQESMDIYIVACQAHPALVKIGPVLVPSFYF